MADIIKISHCRKLFNKEIEFAIVHVQLAHRLSRYIVCGLQVLHLYSLP